MDNSGQDRYRFGPFTLSRHGLVLKKGGTRIPLRPQAASLLLLLLDRRPNVVSREEIEAHLWERARTEIDAGQQINTCIRLIRKGLNDHAKAPTYIETFEGGYRFIAPVDVLSDSDETRHAAAQDLTGHHETELLPIRADSAHSDSVPPESGTELGVIVINDDAVEDRSRVSTGILPKICAISLLFALLTFFVVAAINGAYGLAILVCCTACVWSLVLYSHAEDGLASRSAAALILAWTMAYIPSAATLPQVISSVVNAETIRPAFAYPFVTGLKFIPLIVVVLFEWVWRGAHDDAGFKGDPRVRLGFLIRGGVVLLVAAVALITSSGEDRIWRSGVPARTAIVVYYGVILAINGAVWLFWYYEFERLSVTSYRRPLMICMVAYLPLALIGFLIDQEYNFVNLHYLDKRRPETYFARNPNAIEEFRRPSGRVASEIGPGLRSLLQDPMFQQALRTQPFYKQDFDEPFQFGVRAIMFGFRINNPSLTDEPRFLIIRFPGEMAEAIRFQALSR